MKEVTFAYAQPISTNCPQCKLTLAKNPPIVAHDGQHHIHQICQQKLNPPNFCHQCPLPPLRERAIKQFKLVGEKVATELQSMGKDAISGGLKGPATWTKFGSMTDFKIKEYRLPLPWGVTGVTSLLAARYTLAAGLMGLTQLAVLGARGAAKGLSGMVDGSFKPTQSDVDPFYWHNVNNLYLEKALTYSRNHTPEMVYQAAKFAAVTGVFYGVCRASNWLLGKMKERNMTAKKVFPVEMSGIAGAITLPAVLALASKVQSPLGLIGASFLGGAAFGIVGGLYSRHRVVQQVVTAPFNTHVGPAVANAAAAAA